MVPAREDTSFTPATAEMVRGFCEHLRLTGRQRATIESYGRDARMFLEFLTENRIPIGDVSPDLLLAYQTHLRHEIGERDNSIRRHVIGVRQFFRYLAGQDGERRNGAESAVDTDAKRAKAMTGKATDTQGASPLDFAFVPERDESLGRQLTDAEINRLLSLAGQTSPALKATRDRALVALLALDGIKANELISLGWENVAFEGSRGILKVPGSRSRTITLDPQTVAALRDYANEYRLMQTQQTTAGSSGARPSGQRMFVAFKGKESVLTLPEMTRHGMKFIMYELGERAGIHGLNSEMLRHHAITWQMSLGKSPEAIMEHLGLRRLGNIAKHFASHPASASESSDPGKPN